MRMFKKKFKKATMLALTAVIVIISVYVNSTTEIQASGSTEEYFYKNQQVKSSKKIVSMKKITTVYWPYHDYIDKITPEIVNYCNKSIEEIMKLDYRKKTTYNMCFNTFDDLMAANAYLSSKQFEYIGGLSGVQTFKSNKYVVEVNVKKTQEYYNNNLKFEKELKRVLYEEIGVTPKMTEYQAIRKVYDWFTAYGNMTWDAEYSYKGSPWTVLFDHIGVCSQYSACFNYWMNLLGIENEIINSFTFDHSWNRVKLDGEWYYIDLTWDINKKNEYKCYFLCSAENIAKSHRTTSEKREDTGLTDTQVANKCLNSRWQIVQNKDIPQFIDIKYTNGYTNPNPLSVTSGSTIYLKDASREGYKFMGWYTNIALTKKITKLINVKKTTKLYAKWEKASYTIKYINGYNNKNITNVIANKFVTLKNPTRTGYKFLGWYTDSKLTKKVTGITVVRDTTLYAKWKKNK